MRPEAALGLAVIRRLRRFRRSLIGVGLLLALNAVACGDSSVLSSVPDGGPVSTGSGGATGTGGWSGSGGADYGSGGSWGTGGDWGSGGFMGSGGSWGHEGSGGAPGWREARMIGIWLGGDRALRIIRCSGEMPTSVPFEMVIRISPTDGTLIAYDTGVCEWRVRVAGGTASVPPGSTCRDQRGPDLYLYTVNELSVSSADGWSGIASGALSLTVAGSGRTLGCTVSVEGPVTKMPMDF